MNRAEALPQHIIAALKTEALDRAVLFSADEARAFAMLVQRANLDDTTTRLIAVVASPVVAAPLTVLKFARVVSAPKSDAATVTAMVDDARYASPSLSPRHPCRAKLYLKKHGDFLHTSRSPRQNRQHA